MLKTMERLLHWTTGGMAAAALFSIMWLTLLDVLSRKFLTSSIPGALEITEVLMVVVIFGAMPLVSWRGEHVVFDSLDAVIPDWLRNIQGRVVNLVCAATFGFLGYLMTTRAERFAEYGDTTVHLQLSIAPVAWLMAALLVLSGLIHLLFVFVAVPAPSHALAKQNSTESPAP